MLGLRQVQNTKITIILCFFLAFRFIIVTKTIWGYALHAGLERAKHQYGYIKNYKIPSIDKNSLIIYLKTSDIRSLCMPLTSKQ